MCLSFTELPDSFTSFGVQGKPLALSFQARTMQLNPVGTLQTGAAEDSRIYISLADFSEWTRVLYSTVEISASGSPEEISATIQRLTQALPGAEVRAVRTLDRRVQTSFASRRPSGACAGCDSDHCADRGARVP